MSMSRQAMMMLLPAMGAALGACAPETDLTNVSGAGD